jgi:proteasome lid subunit RPN8/RPN11
VIRPPCLRARTVRPLARRRGGGAVAHGATLVHVADVLERICAHAAHGYNEPYKREVIGILLGRRTRPGGLRCVAAIPYRTWFRARTRCDPNPEALRRRARALALARGLRYLGCYHSHPEEAGSRAWALSPEDRDVFYADRAAALEVVVSVAASGRRARVPARNPRRNKDGSISLWADGHHFRLSAEAKPV